MPDPTAGPIIKDAVYFGFWGKAILVLTVLHVANFVMLLLIYLELRRR